MFLSLLLSYLKIGLIGFGNANALIPVIEAETVKSKNYVTEDDFTKHTIISGVTPGSMALKLAVLGNERYSLLCAYALCLPGVLGLIAVLTWFSIAGESIIKYIEVASIAISTFIILLLVRYLRRVMLTAENRHDASVYSSIILLAFVLTCGRKLYTFLDLLFGVSLGAPVFSISTLDLMILAFFIICFMGSSRSPVKLIAGVSVAAYYALSVGSSHLTPFSPLVPALMGVMLIFSFGYDYLHNKDRRHSFTLKTTDIKNSILFILVALVLSGAAMAVSGEFARGYLINVLISSFSSFGGGEAYLSVADGFFVHTGYIEAKVFYNQIAAAANALPGPISIKIVAGIGYVMGYNAGGIALGWLLSAAGVSVAIAAAAVGVLIADIFFEALDQSPRLLLLRKYILPAICGMLISTIFSILSELLVIITTLTGLPAAVGFAMIIALFFVMLGAQIMYKKGIFSVHRV